MILSPSTLFRLLLSLLLMFAACVTTGCSSSDEPEPEPAEIATTEAPLIDAPEEDLYYAAKRLFAEGHYLIASENFQSLKDGFPLGPYTEFAEIKLADIDFLMNEFAKSATRYEDALKSRPTSPAVPYLLLQAARSNQLVNTDTGRDPAPLQKAIELYTQLIEKHPDSMYVPSAKFYRDQTRSQLAYYEEMITNFYEKQGANDAFQARQNEYNTQWAQYHGDEESLESSWQPSKPTPRSAVEQVTLASSESLSPEPAPETKPTLETDTKISDLRIREALCESRNGERITLYFNRQPANLGELAAKGKFTPSNGTLTMQLPFELGNEMSVDCFAKHDLSIGKNGVITLSSSRNAQAVDLMNPPRLVLFLR